MRPGILLLVPLIALAPGPAMDRCDHGDTAAGIPILEKKLRNGGFTLPPR
jgi:hypothetical protein